MEKYNICTFWSARNIRKLICVVCCLVMVLLVCSCEGKYTHGLEYCNNLSDGIEGDNLLYDRTFLDKYSYIDGEFHHYGGTFSMVKSLLFLKYDAETYIEAKDEIFSYAICSEHKFNYNGFVFCQFLYMDIGSIHRENIDFSNGLDNDFYMIAYNDKNNTIVTLKYYTYKNEDIQGIDIKTDDDFAEFIERYYLEFYNFE